MSFWSDALGAFRWDPGLRDFASVDPGVSIPIAAEERS